MKRRGFVKLLLGCLAAAALPVVGKAVADKPALIAVDPAKPGSERTVVIRSTPEGKNTVWAVAASGGYMYSDQLSEKLRNALKA